MFHISVRECQPLSELDNGQITPAICNTKPLHGQTCDYECASGYQVNGPGSNKCDDGHWKYAPSTCEGNILLFIVKNEFLFFFGLVLTLLLCLFVGNRYLFICSSNCTLSVG